MSTAEALAARIAEEGFRLVDLRCTDLVGRWRQTSLEAGRMTPELLERGVMIDGSLVPGWRDVAESDLLLRPDLTTALPDPFAAQPTLVILADAAEPATGAGYERDPRTVAGTAEARLRDLCGADEAMCSADLGFFLFDQVRVDRDASRNGYALEFGEGREAGSRSRGSGTQRPLSNDVHLAAAPIDHHVDIRAEIVTVLKSLGYAELRHERGPTSCQNRLAFGPGNVVATADRLQILRHVAHQVAASYAKTATFMPKPIAEDPGASLNLSLSLWREGQPLFAGHGYADLSPMALHFIAGILTHGRALNAFTNPTTNSYKRLQPDMDEPMMLAFAAHNRSAAVRVPFADGPGKKRVEVRFPDPTANPYLALSAVLLAGIDGIERKLEPGDAMDRNLYDLSPEEMETMPSLCRGLNEALQALEKDHGFLTRDEIMPTALLEAYVEVKRRELAFVDRQPTPVEFELYYGL